MRWSAHQVAAHRRARSGAAAPSASCGPGGDDRPRRPAIPVSSAWPMPSPVIGSVAAAASPTKSARPRGRARHVVDPGRDGPGPVRRLGRGVGAEDVARCAAGPAARATARSMSRTRVDLAAARGCRSRRWPGRPAAGTTTRSRAAGRARTTRTARGAAAGADAGEVLAEGVPLAEVAGLAGAEQLAHRRPHAVGADRRSGPCTAPTPSTSSTHPVVGRASAPTTRVPVVHLGAGGAGHVEQGGVEVGAAGDGGVRARRRGAAGSVTVAPRRRAHDDVVDRLPRRRPSPGRGRAPRAGAGRRW